MAVDSVNTSNNNAGLYAAGAAVVGGGAGASIGYATKSILKDGKYTDEFISQTLKSDKTRAIIDIFKVDPKSETYLTDMVEVMKKHAKTLGLNPAEITKTDVKIAEALGGSETTREIFEQVRTVLVKEIGEEVKLGKDSNIEDLLKRYMGDDLDEVFDRSKKAFKDGIKEDNEILKIFKSAQKNLKLKSAGIYGAIGAGVLGLGTLLCCAGKKEVPQQEKVDTVA